MGYDVVSYSIEKLKRLFEEYSNKASSDVIENKKHTHYFKEYFAGVNDTGAQTIIIEENYIDHDYLEDYTGYYVRCFNDYKKKCTRLHFFSNEFDKEHFNSILAGEKDEPEIKSLKESYIGFIVVKPLPKTIIGRTCLKTYSTAHRGNNRRSFQAVRNYKVNLFGISLNIDSIAFQEQDTVAAACASSALWSLFNKTGMLFQHSIPSPIEITKAATSNFPSDNRILPGSGLTLEMAAQAVRYVGLEPHCIKINNNINLLKANIHAYLKAKIPIYFHFVHYDLKNKCFAKDGHAVTITGYNLPDNSNNILKSFSMDKIYVHDDNIGPFARMVFDTEELVHLINEKEVIKYNTLSINLNRYYENIKIVPFALLVPLYNKIRIPIFPIDRVTSEFLSLIQLNYPEKLTWDIYLTTTNDLKEELFNSNPNNKTEVLTKNLPRFIWCTNLYCNNEKKLGILFDATDIEQGAFINEIINYDQEFYETMVDLAKTYCEELPYPSNNNIILRCLSEEVKAF